MAYTCLPPYSLAGLFSVTIRQALFIAPCSHAFHYKCIRPLLDQHHPAFSCPLCRTFANLEEDVEVEVEGDDLESIAEASAIMASVAAAVTPVMPAQEHSRERDAGAETEVEQDGGSRLGASLRRRPVPTFGATEVLDLTEDADQEMMDIAALPALPEDLDDLEEERLSGERRRDLSVSPIPARHQSTDLLFDPDVESGGGEADAGASGSDSSGHGEGILNNKRKR